MDNKISIACTIDDCYVQHCGVMLCSLLENNSQNEFEIYIVHEQLSPSNQEKLATFLKDQYQQRIQFLAIRSKQLSNFPIPTDAHVSIATYFRVLLANTLPSELEKVLFLDVDMIVCEDISSLWSTDITEYFLGGVSNPRVEDRKAVLGIPSVQPYFNGGVLLLNLKKWRSENTSKKILHMISTNPKKLKFWDQDALNAVLWGQWKELPPEWNVIEAYENYIPKIVHFIGASKPWHLKNEHPYRSAYFHYLKKTPWKNYSPLWEYLKRVTRYYLSK